MVGAEDPLIGSRGGISTRHCPRVHCLQHQAPACLLPVPNPTFPFPVSLHFQIFFPLEAWVVGRVSDEMLSSFMTHGLKFKAFLPRSDPDPQPINFLGSGRLCLWFLVSTELVLHHLIPYLHNPESFLQSLYHLYTFPSVSFTKKYDQRPPPLRGPGGRAGSQALIKSAYLLYG